MRKPTITEKLRHLKDVKTRLNTSLELVYKTEKVGTGDAIAMFDFFFHLHIKNEEELRKLLSKMKDKIATDIKKLDDEIAELERTLNVQSTAN